MLVTAGALSQLAGRHVLGVLLMEPQGFDETEAVY